MIRVFDQNIWCNRVIANRSELLKKMIKAYDADICMLQECRPCTHRVEENDVGAMLAGTYAEVEPTLWDRNHTPIFYRRARFDVLDSGYELFEGLNNIDSKSITWAVLYDKIDDCRFAVMTVHFWYATETEADFAQRIANVHQVKACCDRIVEKHDVPVLIAGDLNCGANTEQGEAPYEEMLRVGMRDARRIARQTTDRHTIHALPVLNEEGIFANTPMPTRTLDHAFFYGKDIVDVHSFNVLVEQNALDSSDHCPLLVTFEIPKARDPFVNFAHRGASEYAPENTLSSFYLGLRMGANGIETDVQITKDGVLVLFHDDTLSRVTGCEGAVSDYTYEELSKMRVRNAKTGEEDTIVRFEDFLRYFGWRDLTFAIELKKPGYEAETIAMMDRFDMRDKSIITSFKFPCIERVKELRPDYRVGYLIKGFDEEKNEMLLRIGGEQVCPQAKYLTKETVAAWRALGFSSVRAWGITDTDVMRHACECGVDGMTVNFPDQLTLYRKGKRAQLYRETEIGKN